jgi:hypothetical protein
MNDIQETSLMMFSHSARAQTQKKVKKEQSHFAPIRKVGRGEMDSRIHFFVEQLTQLLFS